MYLPRVVLSLAALLSLAGCGANVVFQDDGGEAGGGGSAAWCADVSFDFEAPASVCLAGSTCELNGVLPDGRTVRETCVTGKTSTCTLSVDDVPTCACPEDRIDYASACGNGVPTCADWKIDWSDIGACDIP